MPSRCRAASLLGTSGGAAGADAGEGMRMESVLQSWNDSTTKAAILEFVERVTDEDGADYVPVDERIAVFDNDGTLWCEKPMPIELGFVPERLAGMVDDNAALRDKQPWAAAAERDHAWLAATLTQHYHGDDTKLKLLMGGMLQAYAGWTVDAYAAAAASFLHERQHPVLGRAYWQCGYQPMIELLRFLSARGFTNYIASGGDRDFMRP